MPYVGSLSYLSWVFDVSFYQLCVVVSGYMWVYQKVPRLDL